MSKTVKNKCQYKFIRGDKEGEICGAKCKNKYCFKHKQNNKEYKAQWYRNKKQETFDKRLDKIKNIKCVQDLPDINKEIIKLKHIECKASLLLKQLIGIRIALGYNHDDFIARQTKHFNRRPYIPFNGDKKSAETKILKTQ